MSFEGILGIIVSVICSLMMIGAGLYERYKKSRKFPNGKRALYDLESQLNVIKFTLIGRDYIKCSWRDTIFNVSLKKTVSDTFETMFPKYESITVYINDVAVLQLHTLDSDSKSLRVIEYDESRLLNEIIEIINATYKEAIRMNSSKHKEKPTTKSFLENSNQYINTNV